MKGVKTVLIGLILLTKSLHAQQINDTTKTVAPKTLEETESPLDTLTRAVNTLLDDNLKAKRLKITGYVQPQYQYVDSAGAQSFAGGDFKNGTSNYYSRFTMRRGRFKFTYTYDNVVILVNIDARETGLAMRETYAKYTDPKWNMFSLTAGLLQVQFGYELNQSSSERETPERARFNQILFPVERDLGAFASIVIPKSSKLYGLKIDLAAMNGVAGVAPEFDNNKDYTGRLQYSKVTKSERIKFDVGTSGYFGGFKIGNQKDYNTKTLVNGDKGFEQNTNDTANYNRIAKRIYMGIDAQCSIDWRIGITTLRAEYIQGEQPATNANNQRANNSAGALPTTAIYHRNFNGAYFYWVQDILTSKFQVVLKYDWYDPNVKIGGSQIGVKNSLTNAGDIRFDTYGFGLNYHINQNAKIMAYYDIVKNENTELTGYKKDLKDNVFTLRFQVKF
jgi:phosphate-selective porin